MKTRMLTALARCATVCSVATSSAQEADDLIESATPSAPKETAPYDLLNPQRGMIFSVYGPSEWTLTGDDKNKRVAQLRDSLSTLPKTAAAKTAVDKGDKFSIDCAKGTQASAIRWEGYLKSKLTTAYTFTAQRPFCDNYNLCALGGGYAVRVNNKTMRIGCGQSSFDVELKAGFNKIEIFCYFVENRACCRDRLREPLKLLLNISGSEKEPMQLKPAVFWHDEKPLPLVTDTIE